MTQPDTDTLADADAIEREIWHAELHPDDRVRAARQAAAAARAELRRAQAAAVLADARVESAEATYALECAGLELLRHARRAD